MTTGLLAPVGLDLGGVRLDAVLDGVAELPVDEAFGDQAEALAREHPEHFADGVFRFPLGAFLVRGSGRVVLVDAGAGPRDSWARSGALLDNLAELGVTPSDVDDVVYTHLHWDHVGWASQKGVATFPRATHHCHRLDWAYFYGPQPGATRRLGPIADDVRLFDVDGPLLPHVEVLHAPGHTPGSTVVTVVGERERVALLGDVVHCPFQLHETGWRFSSDVDPDQAIRTREQVAEHLRRTGTATTAAHFPDLRPALLAPTQEEPPWT